MKRSDFAWLTIPLAILAAYWPALGGGPLWDDFGHITAPELRSVAGLWRIWSELGATQQYYPLLHSAFWFQHRLWGDSFIGYHVANVVFHSASAFLVVLILRRLAVPGAIVAGLFFALHPVAVESAAWISEQKNTLSAMFYLASAYVYLRGQVGGSKEQDPPYVPHDAPPYVPHLSRPGLALQTRHYWMAFAFFICALLSKSVTATLPAALLVVLWWKHGQLQWRRDVRPLLPWFAVAVIAGAFTVWFEREIIGARGEDFSLTLVERGLLAGRVIWCYLGKLFWPGNLIFIYPRWEIDASLWWQYLPPAGAIALAAVLARVARRNRGPLAGYLYFCGTLVPVLGFFDVYPFRFSYVADHFQYLASLGVIVPVASVLTIASERFLPRWRILATVLVGVLVAALAVATWNRSAVYRDAETLYRDTIARNPGAWMAYQNLGTELAARNRLTDAIAAFEGAIRVKPDYASAKANLVLAHMKVADAAAESPEQIRDAIAHYEAALRIDPDHFRARYNAGTLLMDVPEREAEAIVHLERAVELQPESVEARVNLGVLLADVPSRSGEAIEHLEFAVVKRPELAHLNELIENLKNSTQRR